MSRSASAVRLRALPIVAALAAVACAGASASPGAWAGRPEDSEEIGPPEGVEPLLDEDFDGGDLDGDIWGTCHWWAPAGGCTIATNDELEWYVDDSVTVEDGVARLTARDRPITVDGDTYPYRSGMISSGPASGEDDDEARFAFTYGYVEARLRLPVGKGLWPSFWLLPEARVSRPEIDIVETLGDTPDTGRFHYHWVDPGGDEQSLGHDVVDDDLAEGWHTYAVDWRPGRITWIVDGTPIWQVGGPSVSSEPMYVVLNLAVGGEWPGEPDDDTRFPATIEADWIRVWPAP